MPLSAPDCPWEDHLIAAVMRPGRFDLQLFVGTPNLASRMARFKGKLDAALLPVLPTSAVSGVAQASVPLCASELPRSASAYLRLPTRECLPVIAYLSANL